MLLLTFQQVFLQKAAYSTTYCKPDPKIRDIRQVLTITPHVYIHV